jgi:hypothetical protein
MQYLSDVMKTRLSADSSAMGRQGLRLHPPHLPFVDLHQTDANEKPRWPVSDLDQMQPRATV